MIPKVVQKLFCGSPYCLLLKCTKYVSFDAMYKYIFDLNLKKICISIILLINYSVLGVRN